MKSTMMFLFLIASLAMLSACSVQNLAKDGPNGQTNVNQVNLERDFQRIITYDCNHNVKSDSIETVLSPTAWVRISPDDPRGVDSSSFYDEQTAANPGLISNITDFQVDYSYGALNMHVQSGINTIDYKFYHCTQWVTDQNGNKTCAQSQVQEKGTSTLNVNYTEKHLDGYQEHIDCPSPTPTPAPGS